MNKRLWGYYILSIIQIAQILDGTSRKVREFGHSQMTKYLNGASE